MSFLPWIIGGVVACVCDKAWGFKSFKTWGVLLVTFVFCGVCFGDNEDELVDAGKEYVLSKLNAPSSAVFLSHVSSANCRKVLEDWGVELKSKHDVIQLEVEATNGFGGRVKQGYIIFFVDGKPIEMVDGDWLNASNVDFVLSSLKDKGW